MSRVLGALKPNAAYIFFILAAAWLGLTVYLGSAYVLWPALASGVAGGLLKLKAGTRLTWAWATSACVLGLLLSAYIAWAAWPFTGGAFSTTAYITLGAFAVFALFHVVILYRGIPSAKQARSD